MSSRHPATTNTNPASGIRDAGLRPSSHPASLTSQMRVGAQLGYDYASQSVRDNATHGEEATCRNG